MIGSGGVIFNDLIYASDLTNGFATDSSDQ